MPQERRQGGACKEKKRGPMNKTILLPNGHPLRLIASDMDGTILRSDLTIEPRTKELLIAWQKEGIRLTLISGRPIQSMMRYARELEMDHHEGVIIGANGGHAYQLGVEKELWRHTLTIASAQHYFQLWKPFLLTLIAYGREKIYVDVPKREGLTYFGMSMEKGLERIEKVTTMKVEHYDLSTPLPEDPVKACVLGDRSLILKAQAMVKEDYEADIYGAFSAETYFEAMMRGINKGTGLQEYADRYDILPDEMVAFGDEDNDIPMLAYAGVSVAMEKASDRAASTAKYRTGSNNAGGIYQFLSRLTQEK